ncbi:aspartate/glutamate racemase family protein [Asticcacaulis sp. 201]|uniref:aspartate/glutamate racemase family protein n=1 Tax=Asticcacaulis sp. 201 TaxID=3028787 RepID=UPI0029164F15|nr:aspartate/glutamate racemase family protein [Asticcacaulis sp. 201]MDV6330965.1 aspartate/glutamate racemase family protein [Asticcacaulis sp. 201]
MNEPVRIALIHALEESVLPIREAFARLWPEAYTFDLLDTSLAVDLAHTGTLDRAMMDRFQILADYALASEGKGGRTQGILFTCSAFGPAIDAVKARLPVPVLRPNESAFEAALEAGDRIGLIVTFGPSLAALKRELVDMAKARGRSLEVNAVLAEGALAALKAGDVDLHDRLVADAAGRIGDVDAVVLGQFSMARAHRAVERATHRRVISTPDSAVVALQRSLRSDQDR